MSVLTAVARFASPRPDPYLVGGEVAVLTVHRHWIEMGRVAAETLGLWLLAGLLITWLPAGPVSSLLSLVVLAALLRLMWELLEWRRTTITLSDKRLFVISGILSRRLSMLPLRKVTDMTLVQPLGGRLLGYGSIIVESAGQHQALSEVHHIPAAMDFYREVASLVFDDRPARGRRPDDTMALDEI